MDRNAIVDEWNGDLAGEVDATILGCVGIDLA